MTALSSLFGFLGRNRSFLTLIALAVAAAWLWASYASTRADLADTTHRAERICAAAGSAFVTGEGKPGEACAKQVQQIARFRSEAQGKTAETLIAAMRAREEKQARDAERRQARLEARLAALSAINTAEEQVHDDQVTGSWFAALNRVAGLRAPRG